MDFVGFSLGCVGCPTVFKDTTVVDEVLDCIL